jgi:hypothetical protein
LNPSRAGNVTADNTVLERDRGSDDRVSNAGPQELVAVNDNRAFRRGGCNVAKAAVVLVVPPREDAYAARSLC